MGVVKRKKIVDVYSIYSYQNKEEMCISNIVHIFATGHIVITGTYCYLLLLFPARNLVGYSYLLDKMFHTFILEGSGPLTDRPVSSH